MTASAGALAGCLGDDEDDEPPTITGTTFETGISTTLEFSDDPLVDIEDNEIVVTGMYSTGNACYDEDFPEPTYDEDDDELTVRLGRIHDGSDECDDLEEMVSYRVTVAFEGSPPGQVHVTEDMGGETTVTPES